MKWHMALAGTQGRSSKCSLKVCISDTSPEPTECGVVGTGGLSNAGSSQHRQGNGFSTLWQVIHLAEVWQAQMVRGLDIRLNLDLDGKGSVQEASADD